MNGLLRSRSGSFSPLAGILIAERVGRKFWAVSPSRFSPLAGILIAESFFIFASAIVQA